MVLYVLFLFMIILVALFVHENVVEVIQTLKDGLLLFGAYGSEIMLFLLLLKIFRGEGSVEVKTAFANVNSVFRYGLMGVFWAVASPLGVSLIKDMVQKKEKNSNEKNVE
ncbi:MAG: hypothetical protein HFE84_09315 [Lachnospiraceae bacterium]|nr:hypothetical protein [Lachnospiraceae bacterium]